MKVLILGTNGQLGKDLFKLINVEFKNATIIPCNRHQLDLTDLLRLEKTLAEKDFDVLINCTGYTLVDNAEKQTDLTFLINAYAVEKLAQICDAKQAKFIHVSTDYVFGGNTLNLPITENHHPAPLNVYGHSKLLGEQLALTYCSNTFILRTASLYGVHASKTKGNFVETMLRLGKERTELKVIADQYMSPTHSADLAEMIVKAIEANISPGIYHAVNSGQASWYEFACAIMNEAKLNCKIAPISASEYPLPAKRPSYSVLDNTKLSQLIGPIPSWQEALEGYFKLKPL